MSCRISVSPSGSPSTLNIPAGFSSSSYQPDLHSLTQSTAEMRLLAPDSEEMVLEPKINQEEEEYCSAKTSYREVLFYRQKAEEHRSKMRVVVMSRPLDDSGFSGTMEEGVARAISEPESLDKFEVLVTTSTGRYYVDFVWRELIEELANPDTRFGAYAWKYTLNWTGEILTFQLGQVDDVTFRGIWHDLTPLKLPSGSGGCIPNAPQEKGMTWRYS
jgi:hypothetical protein